MKRIVAGTGEAFFVFKKSMSRKQKVKSFVSKKQYFSTLAKALISIDKNVKSAINKKENDIKLLKQDSKHINKLATDLFWLEENYDITKK